MDVNDYSQQLKTLLPPGKAFPRERVTALDNLLLAMAEELARVDSRSKDLLRESYPLTADETLTDWERITGLPSACIVREQTKLERQEAVFARLGQLGGQSRQYFIDLAATVGFIISITEFFPFKAGKNKAGDPVNGSDWLFYWQVNAPEETIKEFKASRGAAGEALRTWGNEVLECIISEFKPAHTNVIFTYGSS